MTFPRTFSHIGISVTDLDRAVDFYTNTLGWYVIMPPTEIVSDDSAIGVMCNDVFGEGWGRFRIAHLATGDRIGIELFEFVYVGEDLFQIDCPTLRLLFGEGEAGQGREFAYELWVDRGHDPGMIAKGPSREKPPPTAYRLRV